MQNYNPHNEPLTLSAIAEGDHDAFKSLFLHYKDRLFHVAHMYTHDTPMAEEIVQEVFMKVWIYRSQLRDLSSFESWLFIVTRNQVTNWMQKWSNRKLLEQKWGGALMEAPVEPETDEQKEQYSTLLEEAVQSLPSRQQTVFRLSKEKELTYELIGLELGISTLTVKTHMKRALEAIRHYLSRQGDRCLFFVIFLSC